MIIYGIANYICDINTGEGSTYKTISGNVTMTRTIDYANNFIDIILQIIHDNLFMLGLDNEVSSGTVSWSLVVGRDNTITDCLYSTIIMGEV